MTRSRALSRRVATPLFVAAIAFSCWARAGLDEGLAALRSGDFPVAVKELRPLAERGDAEAQYRIGLMYEFGRGYPQDKAQGLVWLRKSAAQGHSSAQQELGVIYTTGDGVPRDNAQAAAWFQRSAAQNNPTAQYNLGLMYAKGTGMKQDNALAIIWFRKAAVQGLAVAQFKLGVAYANGQGVAKDPAVAYANYAIAARGNAEYAAYRDDVGKTLSPAQLQRAQAAADAWTAGQPMPTTLAANASPASTAAAAPPAKNRCSATGTMEGEKFTANYCAVSFYGDAPSVAIWFNEEPITAEDAEAFAFSAHADDRKGGKPRTMATIMFCPGGGQAAASAGAVKSIDLNTNHAKSPLAGVQWVVTAPKDFKVEKMTGEAKPGGALAGRITGGRGKTTWTFDFDVALPVKDAAAGLGCK